MVVRRTPMLLALAAGLLLAGCSGAGSGLPPGVVADTTTTDTTSAPDAATKGAPAALLSAFFGLDNGLPLPAERRLCAGAGQGDGMPVIFSHEVDQATMQAGDFRVLRASGAVGRVDCVTLAPAVDAGELRTALLIGEYGSAEDPPVAVEVAGNLLSLDGQRNFQGARVEVTPLAPGPTLVLAELAPEAQWKIDQAGGPWGLGSGCPRGTTQAVRVVWAGGVTRPGGGEAGEAERQLYQLRLSQPGGEIIVAPFALGDLDDGDNNHLLCLDVAGAPLEVSFPAGALVDPNDDLNPATSVIVTLAEP